MLEMVVGEGGAGGTGVRSLDVTWRVSEKLDVSGRKRAA